MDLEECDNETIWTDLRSIAYLLGLMCMRWILRVVLWVLIVAGIAIIWEVIT